jgi:hypothetical protein
VSARADWSLVGYDDDNDPTGLGNCRAHLSTVARGYDVDVSIVREVLDGDAGPNDGPYVVIEVGGAADRVERFLDDHDLETT